MIEKKSEDKSLNRILSLLSQEGTLTILNEAQSKLISRRETHGELGLTKRQYYRRLRGLKEFGLIRKEGEGYVVTERGENLYRPLIGMMLVLNGNQTENEDIFNDDILSSYLELDETKFADVITNYDELVDKVVELIETSTSEVVLATRYVDHRVIKAYFESGNQASLRSIVREISVIDGMGIFKSFPFSKPLEQLAKLVHDRIRVLPGLPYSFLVKDREIGIVETVNPFKPNNFFLASISRNKEMCEGLYSLFNRLYEKAEEWPSNTTESSFNLTTVSDSSTEG